MASFDRDKQGAIGELERQFLHERTLLEKQILDLEKLQMATSENPDGKN